MHSDTLNRMIADLHAMESPDGIQLHDGESLEKCAELSACYLIASSPDKAVSDKLRGQLLKKIDTEPARVTTDRYGLVTAINPAFSALCGYSFDEVKGRKPGALLQGKDTDPHGVEALRNAVSEEKPCSQILINYHKDGSPYRVKIDIEPIRNERLEVIGFRAEEVKLPL